MKTIVRRKVNLVERVPTDHIMMIGPKHGRPGPEAGRLIHQEDVKNLHRLHINTARIITSRKKRRDVELKEDRME